MRRRAGSSGNRPPRDRVVVWLDSRGARIARHNGSAIELERIESDVPARSAASGHIRHDPAIRHGGGGDPQSAADRRRHQHLAAFLGEVERRLSPDADVELLGPGTVHEQLGRELREHDVRHGRRRTVMEERAGRLTDRQLAARLRSLVEPAPSTGEA